MLSLPHRGFDGRKEGIKDMTTMKERVLAYAKRKYGSTPDHPFSTAPDYWVLRHSGSGKWYALFMLVPRFRLGIPGEDPVEILNLKCDPLLAGSLRDGVGIFPGYHLNHANWITLLLDGTVEYKDITPLLDLSWQLTGGGGPALRGVWLVPANPAYYDIEKGLSESADGTIGWKQSSNVRVGDTVYIYVAAPVSAIKYKCKALEVNIPREYIDGNVSMRRVMRLEVLTRYDTVPIGRDLMAKYGVHAVRGPRGMPPGLEKEIDELYREK